MKASKIMAGFLALTLAGALAAPTFAAQAEPLTIAEAPQSGGYTLTVNGNKTDVQPCIMVPLRAVAEALGFAVTWQQGTVRVDDGAMHTELTIGEDVYYAATSIEGAVGMTAPFSLGAAPYLSGGVTYVPLELFRVLLGNGEDVITVDGSTIRVSTGGEQIANPFVDCATLDEAASIAGITLRVPQTVNGSTGRTIRAVDRDMIEVTYTGASGALCIRKAAGSGDVSGDYTVYETEKTVAVNGIQVTEKSENGLVFTAIWTDGGCTYAVMADAGMTPEAVAALVADIH